jgi:citrate lyase subunit beta/citryl-CoA lyase
VVIRINGLGSPWGEDDLAATAAAGPAAILIPKVENPEMLAAAERALAAAGAPDSLRLWAMIETPLAILHAEAVAAAARCPAGRLSCFVLGTNDLAKDTRARLRPGRAAMLPWLATAVAAARAHGVDILDGVFNDFGDADGLRAECEQGRDFGFDGKTLIHPSQIAPANAIFAPSPDEVAQARAIVAAFAAPEHAGLGVISLGGRMVERLHAEMAARTIALADAIAG